MSEAKNGVSHRSGDYYQMSEPFPLNSSRFMLKDTTKIITNKQLPPDYYSSHKIQSMSKYHYHLKTDNIYGDKKLKLCGLCMTPGNLVQDLRQLSRLTRKPQVTNLASNGTVDILSKNSEQSPIFLNKVSDSTSSKSDLDSKLEFDVLDLSTDRSSGMNLPILNLPNDLFRFSQLRRLHLDGNQIKVIPEALGEKLTNLEVLTLSGNNLRLLPESMKNLKKMFSLHLANNKFEKWPEVLCSLEVLRFIDFCSNRLVNVSSNIQNLKKLETLLLFDNNIVQLPDSIGNLKHLRTRWLGKNGLKKLPRSICNLSSLDWDELYLSSNLENNPLTDPPIDVCLKGLSAIRDYLNQSK
jgi:Leucine-rich repeat (LRR) protein